MALGAFDCRARLATMNDVDAIVAFYEEHRTPAVYLRKREEIEKSIENELFLIIENTKNQIISASGIYLLSDGRELQECILETDRPQSGKVAELGSVLRWPEGMPEEKRFEGVWHPFLFGVPMVLLLDSILRKKVDIDLLVCDVQTDRITNKQRLMGQSELTPLRWKLTQPGKDLVGGFEDSIRPDDANVHRPKDFFRAEVGNLPEVARYLMKVAKGGLSNRQGQTLSIDMTDLIERWTSGIDQTGRRYTLLGRLVDNAKSILVHNKLGWREFGRIFGGIAQKRTTTLNGAYQVTAGFAQAATSSTGRLPAVVAGNGSANALFVDDGRPGEVLRSRPYMVANLL